jgi:threonine dehydratase
MADRLDGADFEQLRLDAIRATRAKLGKLIVETPLWHWQTGDVTAIVGPQTQVLLKLELFQHTGTFKARGALSVILGLDAAARAEGVTAVSAGNHAIAVAYAARLVGTSAKVVMPKSANPFRVERCRSYGAEVVLVDDVTQAFALVRQIQEEEGRTFVHPFEGPRTLLGPATLGLEMMAQAGALDAVLIPVGGGGLAAGMAAAIKQLQPSCQVIGVEPRGADTMYRSFQAGSPQTLDQVRTIADSLGAPHAAPYSFAVARRYVDEIVLIDDDEMRRGMALLFRSMKLAVEPAGAAATAALCGPLRTRLAGRRVALVVCGANLDAATFSREVIAGEALLADWFA